MERVEITMLSELRRIVGRVRRCRRRPRRHGVRGSMLCLVALFASQALPTTAQPSDAVSLHDECLSNVAGAPTAIDEEQRAAYCATIPPGLAFAGSAANALLGPMLARVTDGCTASEVDQLLDQLEKAVAKGSLEAATATSLWADDDPARQRAWKSYLEMKPKLLRFEQREVVDGGLKVIATRVDLLGDEPFRYPDCVYHLRRVDGGCRLAERAS